MFKLPILATVYEVVEDKEFCDLSEVNGLTYPDLCKIYINPSLAPEHYNVILTHEVLHAILHKLGYHDLYSDEKLVHSLSEALNITFNIEPKYISNDKKYNTEFNI